MNVRPFLARVLSVATLVTATAFAAGLGGCAAEDENDGTGSSPIVSKPEAPRTVTGRIHFPKELGIAPSGGDPLGGVVRVLDVTLADAPSKEVGRATISATNDPLPFEVTGLQIDPQHAYTVAVHFDLDHDGAISNGDLITTESFPVLTNGYGDDVDVKIVKVGPAAEE